MAPAKAAASRSHGFTSAPVARALIPIISVEPGTAVPTTAFQNRALRTSSRLLDGQALLIGDYTERGITRLDGFARELVAEEIIA